MFNILLLSTLQLEEGKKLVRDAIAAGVFNDLGSGSYIDLCVITKDSVDYIRPYEKANLKGQRLASCRISDIIIIIFCEFMDVSLAVGCVHFRLFTLYNGCLYSLQPKGSG